MNWHQVIDERSHEMDQVIADLLRRSPDKLSLVTNWIAHRLSDPNYSNQGKDALQEWLDLIESEGVEGVLRVLDDHGEDADRMRQSSPFVVLMPQEKRMEILKKYESRRVRTSPAGV
jgi:hypothetical protein